MRWGLLGVVGGALGLGGLVMLASRPRGPTMKVPGPCEIRQSVRYPGTDVPPPPGSRRVIRYDEAGHPVLEEHFVDDVPGQPHQTLRWVYDDAGRQTLEERFSHGPIFITEADGTRRRLESRTTWVRQIYDDHGRLAVRSTERDDEEGPSRIILFEYDDRGRKRRAVDASAGDDAPGTTFEYDERGRLWTERSGEQRTIYEYDDQDRIIAERQDLFGDEQPERTVTRRFDAQGRVSVETLDEREIGRRTTTWTYDAFGNVLTRVEVAEELDGSGLEVSDAYDYRCWAIEAERPVDRRPST